jgi:predicted kinase
MPRPKIYVFYGLIASGKSTLAQAFAGRFSLAYYNSDVVRKKLAGLSPQATQCESADQGIYTPEFSRKTYDALLDLARNELEKGRGVVLDASYHVKEERVQVQMLANEFDVPLYFILCQCPEPELQRRMDERAKDPNAVSDGRWEIYIKQRERFDPPHELSAGQSISLNTDKPPSQLLDECISLLEVRP